MISYTSYYRKYLLVSVNSKYCLILHLVPLGFDEYFPAEPMNIYFCSVLKTSAQEAGKRHEPPVSRWNILITWLQLPCLSFRLFLLFTISVARCFIFIFQFLANSNSVAKSYMTKNMSVSVDGTWPVPLKWNWVAHLTTPRCIAVL